MNVYLVGGAVRDALLGRSAAGDRDWVVVGSTPEAMVAAGFRPVGKDFPVFLHPQTHEEYALARTERKTAPGYHGFVFHTAPDVTLAQDLARRDLTVNAIAEDSVTGALIDPFGGVQDLQAKLLRHVSPAFADDPVRILRLARFAARWPDFAVVPETLALCKRMVTAGEADVLVAERVWAELAKGLMEAKPSRMFEVLRDCGALARVLPEWDRLWGVPQPPEHHPEIDTGVHVMAVLDYAASLGASLAVRWACLCHDLGKGTTTPDQWPRHLGHEARSVALLRAASERLRVPKDCKELAEVVAREHGNIHRSASLNAAGVLRLLERCDALRRPERFTEVLQACLCDARGRLGRETEPYPQAERLQGAVAAALGADVTVAAAQAIARGAKGPQIANAVAQARAEAIGDVWHA